MTAHLKPWSGWVIGALALAHGLLFGLAFAPAGIWPLVFLAPAPLALAAVRARRIWTLVGWVFLVQVVVWLALQSWVREISALGWLPMAAYLALYGVAVALVIRCLARSRRFGFLPLAIIAPVAWVGIEYLRGTVFLGGYPWYLLGQPTIQWLPLAQVADLGGQGLASILPAAVGGAIADGFLEDRLSRRAHRRTVAGVVALAIAVVAYGLARIRPPAEGPAGPKVLLLQTNLATSLKIAWTPEAQLEDVAAFTKQTIVGLEAMRRDGAEPDLAVWPETMLPGPGLELESVAAYEAGGWFPGAYFRGVIDELRQHAGVPLLIGSGAFEGLVAGSEGAMSWTKRFNSVYLIDRSLPDARYDKVHLTPFGERMPLISDFPWLEAKLLEFGASGMRFDLDEAEAIVRLPITFERDGEPWTILIGTPICFEDTMPEVCRRMVWNDQGQKVGVMLISLSNDGWFGSSNGGRRTHREVARFRAIENRVPLLRAANTGESVWVDSSGRVRAALGSLEAGTLAVAPRLDGGWTVFGAIGQWPSMIITVVLVVGLFLSFGRPSVGGECVQ